MIADCGVLTYLGAYQYQRQAIGMRRIGTVNRGCEPEARAYGDGRRDTSQRHPFQAQRHAYAADYRAQHATGLAPSDSRRGRRRGERQHSGRAACYGRAAVPERRDAAGYAPPKPHPRYGRRARACSRRGRDTLVGSCGRTERDAARTGAALERSSEADGR